MPCSANAGRRSRSKHSAARSALGDHLLADRGQLLGRRHAVGAARLHARLELVVQVATRTMKNSSRFDSQIAANLARSSSGIDGSSVAQAAGVVERWVGRHEVAKQSLSKATAVLATGSTLACALAARRHVHARFFILGPLAVVDRLRAVEQLFDRRGCSDDVGVSTSEVAPAKRIARNELQPACRRCVGSVDWPSRHDAALPSLGIDREMMAHASSML